MDDVEAGHERLVERAVEFTRPPNSIGNAAMAVLDVTCVNRVSRSSS